MSAGRSRRLASCAARCDERAARVPQVAERAWHSGPCSDEALGALLRQLHALLLLLLGPLQRLLDQVSAPAVPCQAAVRACACRRRPAPLLSAGGGRVVSVSGLRHTAAAAAQRHTERDRRGARSRQDPSGRAARAALRAPVTTWAERLASGRGGDYAWLHSPLAVREAAPMLGLPRPLFAGAHGRARRDVPAEAG